jgi:hypothetical protein
MASTPVTSRRFGGLRRAGITALFALAIILGAMVGIFFAFLKR